MKQNKQLMNKRIKGVYVLVIMLMLFSTNSNVVAQVYGPFPFRDILKKDLHNNSVVIPNLNSNNARFTTEGLQLTDNVRGRFGLAVLNSASFGTASGLKIEFEFIMRDGLTHDNITGDGLSVILFDAAVAPSSGAVGYGLGYSYNASSKSNENGVNGAYLGIGLDQFGNFKRRFSESDKKIHGALLSVDKRPSHVTIRGAGGLNGNRKSGYPLLITRSTLNNNENLELKKSNFNLGAYTHNLPSSEFFSLASKYTFRDGDRTNAAYRKARIEIYPWYVDINATPLVVQGQLVSVTIIHGNKETIIVDKHQYPDGTITYKDNSATSGESKTTINATAPSKISIGFAAATGLATNFQVIKNLEVTLPGSVVSEEDIHEGKQGTPSYSIYPLLNDLGFNGAIILPTMVGNTNHLDPTTFRFVDGNKNLLPGVVSNSTSTTYVEANVGTWTFDFASKELTFVPLHPDVLGAHSIFYDIKGYGQPYSLEQYRCLPTKIEINVERPRGVVVNKMLQPRIILN